MECNLRTWLCKSDFDHFESGFPILEQRYSGRKFLILRLIRFSVWLCPGADSVVALFTEEAPPVVPEEDILPSVPIVIQPEKKATNWQAGVAIALIAILGVKAMK